MVCVCSMRAFDNGRSVVLKHFPIGAVTFSKFSNGLMNNSRQNRKRPSSDKDRKRHEGGPTTPSMVDVQRSACTKQDACTRLQELVVP